MKCVIVVRQADKVAESRARALGCELVVTDSWEVRGDATLFVAPGTIVPWDLLAAGFNFMVRWDAAAPLWRYGVTAADLGTPVERRETKRITRDLRIPVYAPELLFVKAGGDGAALVKAWRRESEPGNEFPAGEHSAGRPPAGTRDERLAFVRALYMVKPRFCALPLTWLADVAKRAAQDMKIAAVRQKAGHAAAGLVNVQIWPNQFVRCYAGQEAEVLHRFGLMRQRREERRAKR